MRTPTDAHEQRRVRKALGLPDPSAGRNTPARSPDESRVITEAAIETVSFIEREAEKVALTGKDPDEMTISELALDNTLYASRVLNQILRKYQHEIKASAEIDLKRDRLAADVANATMRTLARVHEVHLRGQNTDRLAQILEEIKALENVERRT